MSEIRQTKTLFDKTSIHATDYSLVLFSFRDQVTIQSTGLHPDDVITFEIIHLEAGTPDEICGCFIKPGEAPRISAVEKLMCFECDNGEGEAPRPVRLTINNPLIVLNAPQGSLLRAHYEGPGIGESHVWATIGTETKDLLPGMDGCPGTCCVDTEWQENGLQRCDLDADVVERQETSNCGNTRWVEIGPINWQDTGETRCNIADDINEIQQVSDCGDFRWVEGEPLTWTPTGEVRCNLADEVTEIQEVNDCGEFRWVEGPALVWSPTGEVRCNLDDDVTEIQEVNDCGDLRWVEGPALNWQDTGEVRCNLEDDITEIQQVNDCGDLRWVEGPEINWQDTGLKRCTDHVEQIQQVNDCKDIRWIDTLNSCGWIATYELPCGGLAFRPEDDRDPEATVVIDGCEPTDPPVAYLYPTPRPWATKAILSCPDCEQDVVGYAFEHEATSCDPCQPDPGYWVATGVRTFAGNYGEAQYRVIRQEINGCGQYDWKDDGLQSWEDTGVTRCVGDNIERQQTTQFGETRWTFSRVAQWEPTGETRCSDQNDTQIEVQEQSECGKTRWTVSPTLAQAWVTTGQERCQWIGYDTYDTEIQQVNGCGRTRWVAGEGLLPWQLTGVKSCGADGFVQLQVVNKCGDIGWRLSDTPYEWEETGQERCVDNVVQVQEINPCGQTRWTDTARTCGWVPTYALPCGGLAFRPDADRDPEATTALEDCAGNVLGYVYPTPRPGASTEVLSCDLCEYQDVLGYAVDGGSVSDKCKPQSKPYVVQVIQSTEALRDCNGEVLGYALSSSTSGARLLWSNGTITKLKGN